MRLDRIAIPRILSAEVAPLAAVPAEWAWHWDGLAADAAEPNVFAERWFAEAAVRHMPPEGETRLVAIWSGAGPERCLLGLQPVRVETRYGRTPVRHVQNWVPGQAFLGTPLVRRGHERRFWSEMLATLDAAPWAPGFLHIAGLVEDGPVHRTLSAAAARRERPCDTVHRARRALLEAGLSPDAYYEAAVRKKKRKELGRLTSRLREMGEMRFETLEDPEELGRWTEEFLGLQRAGWKGKAGSAFAARPECAAFFRDVLAGAFAAGRLGALRLSVGGRAVAMLLNFHAPPGAFSWKIAFDEDFARFSPGVLIEIENLRVLARPGFAWMDSCAVQDHPMIDSLWRARRSIVRVTVPLAGARRAATFRICRAPEDGSAFVRRLRSRHG